MAALPGTSSSDTPKYLVKSQQAREYDLIHSHKKAQQESSSAAAAVVEQVIEKKEDRSAQLKRKAEEELGVIEKRIAEQKQRVNPFKKSAVVATTWEVRQSKRDKGRAKQDRLDQKRKAKMADKASKE